MPASKRTVRVRRTAGRKLTEHQAHTIALGLIEGAARVLATFEKLVATLDRVSSRL